MLKRKSIILEQILPFSLIPAQLHKHLGEVVPEAAVTVSLVRFKVQGTLGCQSSVTAAPIPSSSTRLQENTAKEGK